MKIFLAVLVFTFAGLGSKAQQNYFVYIQTENKQPFYVKMNDKLMSSSASGYIVIPKLTTGSYTITVGFPKDQWPQQNFPLVIGTIDEGYLLKDFGEKGWGLFNIRTMEMAMAGSVSAEKTAKSNDDLFTNALSGATNTNAVLQPAVKKETAAGQTVQAAVPEKPAANAGEGVEKLSAANDAGGTAAVYVDKATSDTIRVFIPADNKMPAVKNTETKPAENKLPENVVTDSSAAKKTTLQKVGKFIDVQAQKVAKEFKSIGQPAKKDSAAGYRSEDKPVVGFNSDCRVLATNDDFLKIRKRMAAETGDEAMADAAKKFFKLKCYSTEQIKNLSTLFLTDSGKYIFFDAAYPRVNDTQNFSSLVSELHDEYYINRFKAMVRN